LEGKKQTGDFSFLLLCRSNLKSRFLCSKEQFKKYVTLFCDFPPPPRTFRQKVSLKHHFVFLSAPKPSKNQILKIFREHYASTSLSNVTYYLNCHSGVFAIKQGCPDFFARGPKVRSAAGRKKNDYTSLCVFKYRCFLYKFGSNN
jgi:hypothetical protein